MLNRRKFLERTSLLALGLPMIRLKSLAIDGGTTPRMPILFFGHGSPMNAIEENEFVAGFRAVAADLPEPRAILCISAHWETLGSRVTAMEMPRTIHDFGGFPRELFEVEYPAPGAPDVADEVRAALGEHIALDHEWGLDHGTWSVVRHLYPEADIPVLQLSLDRRLTPMAHLELASNLSELRRRGVLIIGSGNLVHNLREVAWNRLDEPGFGYDWAHEASAAIKSAVEGRRWEDLARFALPHGDPSLAAMQMAVPTPEHFLPVLYFAGLLENDEHTSFFNDRALGGSLTMTGITVNW